MFICRRSEESVFPLLNGIYRQIDQFDCVVIIRGGGATSDLSGFDTLALAENVAQFPLPVITGIGHERDESILDMVSHTRVKTPTAAAAFLIDHLQEVLDAVDDAQERIARFTQQKLTTLKAQLSTISEKLPHLFSSNAYLLCCGNTTAKRIELSVRFPISPRIRA